MKHVIVSNLDFEDEFSSPSPYIPGRSLLLLNQKWSSILRLIPDLNDAVRLQDWKPSKEELSEPFTLVPWGHTPSVLERASTMGLVVEGPSTKVVLAVNEKTYSHEWEHRLGIALPYSRVIRTLEGLRTSVLTCPFGWVLKHPMGVSGRGRLVGKAHELPDVSKDWAREQFRKGWELVFEPWVEDKMDFSLHYDIKQDGSFARVGATELVTDCSGSFRGNRVTPEFQPPEQAWEVADKVVAGVAALGYFGPVGLDGLSGRLGKQQILRPLVEINARFTFGRMALELSHWVPKGWSWHWWHPPVSVLGQLPDMEKLPPTSPKVAESGFYRLPEHADPGAQSKTLVRLAESSTTLAALE